VVDVDEERRGPLHDIAHGGLDVGRAVGLV
jgi:hypothetical protein